MAKAKRKLLIEEMTKNHGYRLKLMTNTFILRRKDPINMAMTWQFSSAVHQQC